MSQLALPLQLADHAVFASFLPDGNETAVVMLRELAAGGGDRGCWLWGAASTGKTHLLQAVCEQAGDQSVYVPLGLLRDAGPALLEGLASRALICLDDIDAVAGRSAWERALFILYNQVAEANGRLVAAAQSAPRASDFLLPDLKSRLTALPAFQLQSLDDDATRRALQLRAAHRGLDLPDDTAHFLLSRSRRDMTSLYGLLDRLDGEALRAQRRLTIPFVKRVLDITG
ncbi:MAG: DnaA regulatory inactivator Hda [Gammaproteobacteria bacterium]|nr:DnaA regulatory inactivator Hda [Gammaproteobacteria bacterium]MDH5304552.1 DnaA regulatory inactivator Hda [Gammaproteobacteria bacterium]MDH5322640.1 DnaA regulatory inactivator Hda [Gammaproteobacteria bacterium]